MGNAANNADDGENDFASAMEAIRPDRRLPNPQLQRAANLLNDGRYVMAAKITQQVLNSYPQDVAALQLMAEIATRHGPPDEAESLLNQCIRLAPNSAPARFAYAAALLKVNKPEAAAEQAEWLLQRDPRNPVFRSLKPLTLEAIGEYETAAALWRALTEDYPERVECWLRYGYALRAIGDRDRCVAVFRKVIELQPAFGEAYLALANLKTFRFGDSDPAQIEAQIERTGLEPNDRVQMLFALGKAYADQKQYAKSFSNYARGNALHRVGITHDPDIGTVYVRRSKSVFTREFFREREGGGSQSTEPIFLVGMLRAGSTLVEQILASHSQVEGTRELANLGAVSKQAEDQYSADNPTNYPAVLGKLDAGERLRLGERYLESVRVHRKLGRPRFTDKMGGNYVYIGLLQLILPRAKIVDVRRHPLACGWSNFAQHFAKGQNFSYRLADIGRLYRDYVELTAHFDRVLPGKVHRVFYENLVTNPEAEIRGLLNYLGLPFEESCLQFHKTDRAVTTISSEQVRSPIYRDALEEWRHYEPWLGPLKAALGPVLDAYPAVPDFG
jgi:tetratricopeptide (TPR) repeat protein